MATWVSEFCFRTLKSQVTQYTSFTNRIPFVVNYALEPDEKKLYGMANAYLSLPTKAAYPEMDTYQLSLMFHHTLSSSSQAFANMLNAPIGRAQGDECALLQGMQELAKDMFWGILRKKRGVLITKDLLLQQEDFLKNRAELRRSRDILDTKKGRISIVLVSFGGGKEGRTPDLCNAIAALYQLSYTPTGGRTDSAYYTYFRADCKKKIAGAGAARPEARARRRHGCA